MTSPIFMLQKDGEIISMTEKQFDKESDLQDLLAQHPELLLSDYRGVENFNLLLVQQEATVQGDSTGSNTFYLDHLFLDPKGIPTLVEVKRSTDTRIRREVVGQMLDYAANALLYWPVETIQLMFNSTWQKLGKKPDDVLTEFLGENADIPSYWKEVNKNLQTGNIRLIFAADSIPESLKNIVQFLNSQMKFAEVLAVDIRTFKSGDLQVIVPKVFGQSTQADLGKNNVSRHLVTDDEFLFMLEKKTTPEGVVVAQKLLAWASRPDMDIWRGSTTSEASSTSRIPQILHNEKKFQFFSIWSYGKIDIQFGYIQNYPPFVSEEKRLEFLNLINVIPGVGISPDRITKFPSFPLVLLKDEKSFSQFIKALEWFEKEIRAN